MTDTSTTTTGLVTDKTQRPQDGGPARRTMTAGDAYERAVSKYDLEANKAYSDAELTRILKDAGVDTEQRLAVKLAFEQRGMLQ